MHKTKKSWLGSAILSLLLIGCGEGNETAGKGSVVDNSLVVNSKFAATYLQTIEKEPSQPAPVGYQASVKLKSQVQTLSYDGKLEVTNILTKDKQAFDWPMTQKLDSEGNVETVSHRALTLKPGSYDFVLLLTSKDGKQSQYMAQALGEDVIDGKAPEIDFVLLPNLGETISDFEQVQYVSTLKFSWPAEDLAALSHPQFGLSINGEDETVYTINKETGIAELIMNVEPGEYQLAMRLYDGDLMVGKNGEQNNSVNFAEGEGAKMDVIPLQADVNLNLSSMKDQGHFSFTVPAEVVNEVGSAHELALIVRLGGENVPVQEKVLTIRDENGIYKASDLFETGGQDQLTAYLAFHKVSEASEQFRSVPFASCNTSINVALNQTLGCKLELKRESIMTGRVLGTLMLNVLDQNQQPALGVKVYVGDKLIGLTGEQYSTGSIKAHLVAGDYTVKAAEGVLEAADTITMSPLAVENKVLTLQKGPNVGDGKFVLKQTLTVGNGEDNYIDASTLVDFNGDGALDVILAPRRNTEQIYLNDGQGGFALSSFSSGDNSNIERIAVDDLNGDSKPDIVRATDSGVSVFFNDGKGNLTESSQKLTDKSSDSVALGDIDGDGDLDIVLLETWKAPRVFINNSSGFFVDENGFLSTLFGQKSANVVLADVTGNSSLDIIWAGGDRKNMIFFNDGKGRFTDSGQRLGTSQSTSTNKLYNVAANDLNSDGYVDLVITNADYHGVEEVNQLFINDGKGLFELSDTDLGTNGRTPAIADIDSDGDLDIVIGGKPSIYVNEGNRYFTLSDVNKLPYRADQPLLGDVDGDGDVDLLLRTGHRSLVLINQPL
ncbi:VCBS repeat-containing protein [Photobacterium alginatilyticum]|uniref:VCBS repeat-containing protein n=1 Tax=Photobacterium alginatilyticum TaxID=1775171 RepID=A0ABW9YN21_9GAMM|nr:VCBS repeat-containing protein [Photobacterium alginatilyticum]